MKRTKAFTIMELAVVVAIFVLMLIALAPFVHMAKMRKDRINCADNLMKISLGLHSYAAEHGGTFPATLGELYPNYISDEKACDCPASRSIGTRSKPDYIYTAGMTELSGPKAIIVQDADDNHKKSGKNILRINGSVEWIARAR